MVNAYNLRYIAINGVSPPLKLLTSLVHARAPVASVSCASLAGSKHPIELESLQDRDNAFVPIS